MRRRAAVLGSPITHSLSPVLHRAAYAALGLDWEYTALDCREADLPGLLEEVRRDPSWAGLSLTMPLKTAVLPLLDAPDPLASALGAANTVVPREGRLAGANTDVDGVLAALAEVGVFPRAPAVLGAGGSARAVLGALARLGVPAVDVLARRPPAADPLVRLGDRLGIAVAVRPWGPPGDADLVVATAPASATDELAALPWPAGRALVELVYDPWPTRLAARALAAGAPVAGGLAVLAGQAVGQVKLFTGRTVEVEVLRAAGEEALAARARGGGRRGAGHGTGRP